ncbi:alpha/beta fold hydrolase [Caballeronia sp. LjRoot31]|uniref:alpha/beta fold hydrolase n=1 Tax=Caballeronia sp. LjRoot31 TaxID=3342324 RepID=UPI003ED0FD1E
MIAQGALGARDHRSGERTVRYIDEGTGPALVLLHAFAEDGTLWSPQIRALGTQRRVIAPDLRGAGGSGHANGTHAAVVTMDTHADDIVDLMDHLGVQKAVIGGISLGGYVALSLVLRYPDRVSGLILANTRAGADSEQGRAQREALALEVERRGPQAVVDSFGERPFGPDCSEDAKTFARSITLRQSIPGLTSFIRGMAQRPDRTPALASIRTPTLIVSGTEDILIPSAESVAMQRLIAGSHFVDIPRAGHLSNIDKTDVFNAVVENFLTGSGFVA